MEKPRWTDSLPPWHGAYPHSATYLLESLLTIPFLERLTMSPKPLSMSWWSRFLIILRSMLCMQPMRKTTFNCYGATPTSPNSLVLRWKLMCVGREN
nr:hypothetical protein Iba_scaffold31451CG0010 [Ipomoea batatas]